MGIRRFKSLEEIKALEGYLERIGRKAKQKIGDALGYYMLRDVRCALCNKRHGLGYVVEYTNPTGVKQVVSIGHICGLGIFDDDFETVVRDMTRTIERERTLETLAEQLKSLPDIQRRASEMLADRRGAEWFERAEQSLRRACSPRVMTKLSAQITARSSVIEILRPRTASDPPPPRYVDDEDLRKYIVERVGYFRGISAFRSPTPVSLIRGVVLAPLPAYLAWTPGAMIDNKPVRDRFLQYWKGIESSLEEARMRLVEAVHFFETENLRLLSHLATNPVEKEKLLRLRWNDVDGIVEIGPQERVESVKAG